MAITFDPAKRDLTLAERGLDFAEAAEVLDGVKYQFVDDRRDYGEERITTVGLLKHRMVVVVWTRRGEDRHIISLRKANDRERQKYAEQLG
ncbi:MAG TPA: BrnT family toxin [Sphingomicrobium sp.]|nr:BrnT family toxin [Sphingomicrobium sp.]